MIGKRGVAVAVLVGSVLGAAACGPRKSPTLEPTVEQGEEMPAGPQTLENRVERLAEATDHFASARTALQGHSDAQSRRDLAEAFAKLEDVLVLLEGPQPGGAFRQQMRIIERARTQLTSDSATAPEPTVNAAVRAAQSALADIASDQFADDGQAKTLMDKLRARVDGVGSVRGPIHGFETAEALDEIGAVVGRMADVLRQRLPKEQPATAPTQPATSPG